MLPQAQVVVQPLGPHCSANVCLIELALVYHPTAIQNEVETQEVLLKRFPEPEAAF